MDVQLWITSTGADDDSLTSLYRWLQNDAVSAECKIDMAQSPAPGAMSAGVFEAVVAVVSNGIALTNLVVAVAAWRNTRRKDVGVRIEHEGTVVMIDGGSPEEVARVISLMERSLSDTAAEEQK